VAASVAVVILGGVGVLLIQVAREQRKGLVDTTLEQMAGNLQDRLTVVLRSMSASQGSSFANPVTSEQGQTIGFSRIVVARGRAPDYPREEIYFDAAAGTVVHRPDLSTGGNEITLFRGNSEAVLRQVCFFPSLKADGAPDFTLVNIWLEFDDCEAAGRIDEHGARRSTTLQRTFTIKMRNT
jgi:hypothetical protein